VTWHDKDASGKWLIEHHGDSILPLGGVRDIASWRPLQAEVVHPGRLPDGLLEVFMVGQERPDLFLLELETYPDKGLAEQIARKQMLVFLDRGILPEGLALILHPKPRGQLHAPAEIGMQSRLGFSEIQIRWRVVQVMIESPLIQELMAKNTAQTMQKAVLKVLNVRFSPVPPEVAAAVRTIHEEAKLDILMETAVSCPDLEAFRARLAR
jgi:hypothetical protein